MKLLTDESLRINRFSRDITDSDMTDANEETSIIESDEEIDDILSLLFFKVVLYKKDITKFLLR